MASHPQSIPSLFQPPLPLHPTSSSPHRVSSSPKFGSSMSACSAHSHSPAPHFLEAHGKSHLWGKKSTQVALTQGAAEHRLEHSCRASQLPDLPCRLLSFPPAWLSLPSSWLPPSKQAVGSSSGSPDCPPPSRALRFFDISAGAGALGCSFRTPSLPPRRGE